MKVSIVKCNSYQNNEVRKSLETLLANINFQFKKNLRVLIKPNILSPNPPEKAVTTHPVVIEELCKILKEYDAKITIGESSSYDTNLGFNVSGISNLKKYAKIVNFEETEKQLLDFPSLKKVPFPILSNFDLIINVAKLKTHAFTRVSLCVKNLYGLIPGISKAFYHKLLPSSKKLSKFLLEIHDKVKPQLNILDGILGLEGMGPGPTGSPIESKVLIMGDNAIATDMIASEVMGFDYKAIDTNRLSNVKRDEIELSGEIIKLNFKKPSSGVSLVAPFVLYMNNLFPRPKITFNRDCCSKCQQCGKNCPTNAISFSPYPICDKKKCIRCLCCIEVCPNEAVYLNDHWAKSSLKKVYRRFVKKAD
jgi:uncharacterized protein (DUF362 family)/NAD-dependent dihydropyrimidine dehydrogenase PreA subunit